MEWRAMLVSSLEKVGINFLMGTGKSHMGNGLMCILQILAQGLLPAVFVFSGLVCCIHLQILQHATPHLFSFTLSPYVLTVSIVRLSPLSLTFNLCKSSSQHKIIPITVFVRFSRSDPTQVLWARGKFRFGEGKSQSTEALGLIQKHRTSKKA